MTVNNDKEYIAALRKDDFSAFDFLFHKYSEKIYAFAFSITRDTFAAEEVTQLVFLKIWEKRTMINEDLSFKSFLFSVAFNETISWIRQEKSERNRVNEFVKNFGYFTNETDLTVDFRNIEEIANSFIAEMPDKRKEIFKLSREQGYSNKEIAEKLAISIKTVENQMTIALKFLREKLGTYNLIPMLFYFLAYHQ